MRKLLSLLIALTLLGCVETRSASFYCPTTSSKNLEDKMANRNLRLAKRFTGAEALKFVNYINTKKVGAMMVDRADTILLFEESRFFVAVYFVNDCAIAHIAGPQSALKEFFGQAVSK